MSLKTIRTAAITRLSTLLTGYRELSNVFSIEDNSERDLEKGYTVVWGEGLPAIAETRKYGLNSSLIVVLTNCVETRSADNVAPQVNDLYDDVDSIIKSFLDATFLGIPNTIRGIRDATVLAPELIGGNKYVQINIDFTVDFTLKLNC